MSSSPRRRGYAGYLNVGAALICAVLVAIFALRASNTQPPAIAEFAPQAQQQIKQAPLEQTSLVGNGEGLANGAFSPPPSPLASALPTIKAPLPPEGKVRACIGDPPRQIEDPQSPPCVPYYHGANPGSTWKGVDTNTITIAVPTGDPNGNLSPIQKDLQTFFNKRFEFYGRKINLVPFKWAGNHADKPPVDQYQADATNVDQQIKAFASLNYTDSGGGEMVYYDELAKRKIISIGNESLAREGEAHVDANAPYEWRLLPGLDSAERMLGEWVCKELNQRPATFAGPGSSGATRKFGILVTDYTDGFSPDVGPLQSTMSNCNAPVAAVQHEVTAGAEVSGPAARNSMSKFQGLGVTTILCVCEAAELWLWDMPAASHQAYYPEWTISSFGGGPDWDTNTQAFGTDPSQTSHQFGLSFYNKYVPTNQLPLYWAVKEVDPSLNVLDTDAGPGSRDYGGLLAIASGIQMAGPNLTPQSFEAGLMKTHFPNPGADGPPYYQARVGFGPHHDFHNDGAEIWWSNSTVSTWGGTGAWCWARLGLRYALGQWPTTPAAHSGSCY